LCPAFSLSVEKYINVMRRENWTSIKQLFCVRSFHASFLDYFFI
jgi:hypothetical protein